MNQLSFELLPRLAFDGMTYAASEDHQRLNKQLKAVYEVVKDGRWRTLEQIAREAGYSASACASVSARLRDLRKVKYCSHCVERRRVGGGLYEYRLAN